MEIEQGATAEVEAPEVSMDDTILETLRSMQSENDDSAPAETSTPESPEEKAERIRDASGKFAKADTPETTTEEINPEVTEPSEISPEAWAPPNTWKKGAAEKLRNADPEIQAEVARRESDFHRGIEQYKEAATFGHAIDRAISPYMGTLQQLGVTPDVAISELMKTDQVLRYGSQQDKIAMFHKLAQSYGIDVNQAASYEAPYVDPQVSALQQQVSQMQNYFSQQNQMATQQQEQALYSEIAQFAAKPEHKHFDSVRGHMHALLQAGQADTLEGAYEQAVFANPQTRALVLAEQQAAQRAAAAEKAQAAKKAASVNVRSRSPAPQTAPVGTMDDTIRGFLRAIQS
jgi:hypothetical protein